MKENLPLSLSFIVISDLKYLLGALESIFPLTSTSMEIHVVLDMGEKENVEAQAFLTRTYPALKLIANAQRQGFAANHNQVMRQAQGEYIALLNDDILLQNEALDILVDYLHSHPDVGLVGPQLLNADGSYQVSAYSDPSLIRVIYKISGLALLTRQNSLLRRLFLRTGLASFTGIESFQTRTQPQEVNIIKGVAMVVRRAVIEQVGLMDETTLSYGEEQDWHLRIRQAGWKVVLVPDARIIHFGQGQIQLRLHGQMLIEDRKANLNYFRKHRPVWQYLLVRFAVICFHLLWSLFWLVPSRQRSRIHFKIVQMGVSRAVTL